MSNHPRKFMVARAPNAGIGDHLSCVLGAWWYAKRTGRELVIDWRGSRFNPELGRNCFFDFFEPIRSIGGVRVIADNSVPDIYSGHQGLYHHKWTADNLVAFWHVSHTVEEKSHLADLARTGRDRPESIVIANQHLPLPDDQSVLAPALGSLRFRERFRARADAFLGGHTEDHSLAAIHIRHGNGENIGHRVAYWLDPIDLFRQIRRNASTDIHRPGIHGEFNDNMPPSLTAVRRGTRSERRIYRLVRHWIEYQRAESGLPLVPVLFTDAEQVVEGLRKELPDTVHYESSLLPAGKGPLHQIATPHSSVDSCNGSNVVEDMFTELEILQRCHRLVCIPSQFTIFRRAGLPPERIKMLLPPKVNRLVARFAAKVF